MENNHLLIFFFSALGAFNGFILFFYVLSKAKKENPSTYYLGFLLLMLTIRITKSVFFYFYPDLANIFIQIGLICYVLIFPFLFLFIKSYLTNDKISWIPYIVPAFLIMVILGILYPYAEYKTIWQNILFKGVHLHHLIYLVFSFKLLWHYFKLKNKKLEFNAKLIWATSVFSGVLFIWIAFLTSGYTSYIVGSISFSFILYLIVLLIVFRKKSNFDLFERKIKYKNKQINPYSLQQIEEKLPLLIKDEIYLDPNTSLDKFAKQLKVSKHAFSQYLNENLGQSFAEFINLHRISKAKELLRLNSNVNIEAIGYECGYNSKSSFFKSFKKITGKTPSAYRQDKK